MLDSNYAKEKSRLRAALRKKLVALPRGRFVIAGREVAAQLVKFSDWHNLTCLLGFAATAQEPDTRPILTAAFSAGMVVALPRIVGGDIMFHQVSDFYGLRTGYRGVREPDASLPVLNVEGLPNSTLVMVPGAAFDRKGGRLGWGGGYYDRVLSKINHSWRPILMVGVCMVDQLVQLVPSVEHDMGVDRVLAVGGHGSF